MKSPAPAQLYLDLGAGAHVDLLHSNNRTGVALAEVDSFSGWTEVGPYPKDQARAIAEQYEDNQVPAYVGVQAFKPFNRRCIDNVTFIGAAYVDLDTYTTEYAGKPFTEVWQAIQKQFPALPTPTIAGSSGRGLQLVWCFQEGKPTGFYPHWQVIEDTLVTALKSYGADPKAKDLARVLRLSHSYNPKSGTRADLKQTGAPVTYECLQRWSNAYRKAQHRTRPDAFRTRPAHPGGNVSRLTTKNAYTLHAARLADYRTLAELRGGKFTDHRRTAIYLFACSAAWFCHDQHSLENEVQAFTERYVDRGDRYKPQHIQEIIKRQGEALQGARRKYKGQDVDPRYRHRNSTIIQQLAISETEQHLLSTLIGRTEKKDRKRLRDAARRRKAGMVERATYLARRINEARDKQQMALDLAERGLTKGQIADQIGVTRQSVFNYLKNVKR